METTIRELRNYKYAYYRVVCSYINDWKKNPYTWFKSRFYIETSVYMVALMLRLNVVPNVVTLFYIISGIVGGFLLGMGTKGPVLAASAIFFLKGIFDWSDGHLARITGRTSLGGAILDNYGALVNNIGFQAGLGLYIYHRTGWFCFVPLTILTIALQALQAKQFSWRCLLEKIMNDKITLVSEPSGELQPFYRRRSWRWFVNVMRTFPDDRARCIDAVLLLVVIEQIWITTCFSWIAFLLYAMKAVVAFVDDLWQVAANRWAERALQGIQRGWLLD